LSAAATVASRNTRTGLIFAGIAAAMLALGFASAPLYRAFCQATGFNGTARIDKGAQAPGEVVGKIVSVRFDSNVAKKLPWQFAPEEVAKRVAIGARQMTFFEATNDSDHAITGRAAFNITPDQAAKYFVKIQCFCFNEQTLKAHEHVRMPVVFYVDPALATDPDTKDISEITLSYTFFPVDPAKAGS
jgi:cytochrome c oxidase assembly protein subunit 11